MKPTPIVDSRIDDFAALVKDGVEAWTAAGAIILQLYTEDKDAFIKIRKAHPQITFETLMCFLRIGERKIYAPLLCDSSPGARKLLEMPYEVQEKYATSPVEIVTDWKGGKVSKPISQLTKSEVRQVFGDDSLHTEDQQKFRLKVEVKPKPVEHVSVAIKRKEFGFYTISLKANGELCFVKLKTRPLISQELLLLNGKADFLIFTT